MRRDTIILIILFNLFTLGINIKITFITFAEIFIVLLIIKYIFIPIRIERVSILWALFMLLSWVPYFSNMYTINAQNFLNSSVRLIFWVLFMIIVFPHIKIDILRNEERFYNLIMNITIMVSLLLVLQYVEFKLGINSELINLNILSPIMRSPEGRMLTIVKGVEKIRPASIYIEPSFYALILSINVVYLLYRAENIVDLNKCVFFISTIILSNSFFGVGISLILLGVTFLKYKRNVNAILRLLAFLGLTIKFFPVEYFIDRVSGKLYTGSTIFRVIQPITHMVDTFKYRPFLGLGWNNLSALAFNDKNLLDFYWRTGHIIAYVFTSVGIIGFTIFVGIFIILLKNKESKILLTAIVIGILVSTGDFLIPYFWYLILILSVIPDYKSLYNQV